MQQMSSRERMLAAIEHRETDYLPCSFMIFAALRDTCGDQFEFVRRQVDMGLDTFVGLPVREARRDRATSDQGDLHGLPVRFPDNVQVRDWREDRPGERYSILHREYRTPAGNLSTSVIRTEDWVHGDRVPLFDDFVVPRATKRLVSGPEDLAALRCLLTPPTADEIREFRENARRAKELADELGLMTLGEWSSLFDTACWLCGMQDLVVAAMERPAYLRELLDVIGEWNRIRGDVVLDEGVDVFVRRAWYETCDFLSPSLYRSFILPDLTAEAERCHAAGAKLAVISTSSFTPLLDLYAEAGVDVHIGVDPVQDARADLPLTKRKLADRVAIWGGVNGFVTIETGSPADVRQAVRHAVQTLGSGGGFILSPVDNVVDGSPATWSNVEAFIDEWRKVR